MSWTIFNSWILCVLHVNHLHWNRRKRESYKWEGSLSLFLWIQSFHWIYVWPNKWIEDRKKYKQEGVEPECCPRREREIGRRRWQRQRSEGGVGSDRVEMWFQTPRRERERSEGGVGVEIWFQTLASFLYTKQRNPGCGKCHGASLFGLPLRIDVRSTHKMAISTIATEIQNSI